MWKIYRLTFSDGMVYVGQTANEVSYRLQCHKYKACNKQLTTYLRMGRKPAVDILHKCWSQELADKLEYQEICAIPRRISHE